MISIVIPTLGRATLGPLIHSIQASWADFELKVGGSERQSLEIVVVFDPMGNLAMPVADGVLRTVAQKSGANSARNHGVQQSHGEIIWFLDDDTTVSSLSAFSTLIALFADAKTMAGGGDYISDPSSSLAAKAYNIFCSVWRASAGTTGREQLLGGSLAIRRSTFNALSGFDESIPYGGTEFEFVDRLLRQNLGNVVFSDGLSVVHLPGARPLGRWMQMARLQRSTKKTIEPMLPPLSLRLIQSIRKLRSRGVFESALFFLFAIPYMTASLSVRRMR